MVTTLDLETRIASWPARAECRDSRPGLFYPPVGESLSARREREERAKRVCAQCPVRAECLDHALRASQNLGIWGGLNEAERRGLVPRPA